MFQFTHPRGVRQAQVALSSLLFSFNSRTREGCDDLGLLNPSPLLCFNSRTREGCDFPKETCIEIKIGFNSRTREGCDTI